MTSGFSTCHSLSSVSHMGKRRGEGRGGWRRFSASQGVTMLVRSLPTKSKKELVRDGMYTSATYYGHVHDVTHSMTMTAFTAVFTIFFKG